MSRIDRERRAAVRTLEALGYSYLDGAQMWKPPLGKLVELDRSLEHCELLAKVIERHKAGYHGEFSVARLWDEIKGWVAFKRD